jgi:ribosome biogenesis GTPase
MNGTVYASQGGVYRVQLDSGEALDASLRGRLKRETRTGDRVVIGDRVDAVVKPDGTATIEAVDYRESQIVRRGPGGRRPKVIAANVDCLVVVAAAARPEPSQIVLDRLLVIGESNDLEPALVMNKKDLAKDEDSLRRLVSIYQEIGYLVLQTSTVSGEGLDELRELLCSGISALVGPSGVGKSSLLNAIEPDLELKTGALSHKKGQGRHTTVNARLIPLGCGGLVADTPGFSDVGVWGVDQKSLELCFPEFHPFRQECKYRACTHIHEPNCGVQAALARGKIEEARFGSYRALVQEAADS